MPIITLHQPITFGDSSGDLGGHDIASAQSIALPSSLDPQTLVGDSQSLLDHALGGNDTLGASGTGTVVLGDAVTVTGHARGGDDHVTSSDPFFALALGDALTLGGHAQGGDDEVAAFTTPGGVGVAFGDALTMTDYAKGGDDLLTAGRYQYGDAQILSGFAVGGNDTLIAGGNIFTSTQLYGDGEQLLDHSKGGNDRLVAGPGSDQMWGDAAVVGPNAQTGADTFVFSSLSGQDKIMDFEPGKDHIEFDGIFGSFENLAPLIQSTPDGALIAVNNPVTGPASILVVGINHLSPSDFIFA